jgi:phage terminase large subunit-like protein
VSKLAVRSPTRKTILSRASRISGTKPAEVDYVSIAIAYAEEAVEDRKRTWACRWIRYAAQRFLKDLSRSLGARPPFVFSARQANRHCQFIENLPHVEGVWDTDEGGNPIPGTIQLEPSQVFFLVQLFGFRNHKGGRRFTEALYAVARKNAKSTLAAGILDSCLCLENEPGAQLISAATTGKQARIVWKIAKAMIDKTEPLRDTFDVETFANSVVRNETGALLVPINSKSSTQDGLNPSHTNLDELHAHKTPDLLNVLRSAAGGRRNPLWLYTTTEGYENAGPWSDIRTFAQQVLQGVLRADHFLPIIYALDEEDDEYDSTKWVKANPLIEVNPILRVEIEKQAINAQAMPSAQAEFRIKRCNRQSSTASGWIDLPKFMRCGGPLPLDELKGAACWGAFDLASTTDMASWWLVWKLGEKYFARGRYWVPEDQVRERSERRTVPYGGWVESGFIRQTSGNVIDQDVIRADILEDYREFSPTKIGYDPWNAAALANALTDEGLPLEVFIQGPKSYHPAMKEFEKAYLSGNLVHGSNPVLRWNAANIVARRDVNLNMAPDKKRSTDKIDGLQCVIMAIGLSLATEEGDAGGFFSAPVRSGAGLSAHR